MTIVAEDQTSTHTAARDRRALEQLHAQREFLLQSITDLESEFAAGELTAHRFQQLRDTYVVQAATVLRATEQIAPNTTQQHAPTPPRRRRAIIALVVVVVAAVGGGVLLVRSVNDRQPGQTITGNDQTTTMTLSDLERAAAERPDDVRAQLDYAQGLFQTGQPLEAIKVFDAAARLEPDNPEPEAYVGWIVFSAGLVDEAIVRLDRAVGLDPAYPDAYLFRGLVLLRGRNDTNAALDDLRTYVTLAPPGPTRDEIQTLIDDLAP